MDGAEGGAAAPLTFAEQYLPMHGCRTFDQIAANVAACVAAGVPIVSIPQSANGRRLAICGGGPSLERSLPELAGCDVWGINRTHGWLMDRGVENTLFSMDPEPCLLDCVRGEALLGSGADPSVWGAFAAGKVRAFHQAGTQPAGYVGITLEVCATSAVSAPTLGLWLGYRDITIYGCEGSFPDPDKEGGPTHVYANEPKDILWVRLGGEAFCCNVDHLYQSERLADIIALAPQIFHERSGGLLGAMVRHGKDYQVTGASRHLFDQLWPDYDAKRAEWAATRAAVESGKALGL